MVPGVVLMVAVARNQQNDTELAVSRLSIPLTSDGFVDLSSMRSSSLAKLDHIISNDPNVRQRLDEVMGHTESPDAFSGITEENVGAALDGFQAANAFVFRILAAKLVKHPLLKDQHGKPLPLVLDPQILSTTFAFSAKQHAELDPRAAKLAQKYSDKMPDWLKKNLDLYMFGMMMLSYTAENAKAVVELQIKRDLALVRDQYLRTVANQPKNPQPDTDVRTNSGVQPVNGHDQTPPAEFVSDVPAPPDAPMV
jgi:hypothetical protein